MLAAGAGTGRSYIVEHSPQNARHFKKLGLVKKLVKRLLGLVRSGYQPEYDIAGMALLAAAVRPSAHTRESDECSLSAHRFCNA